MKEVTKTQCISFVRMMLETEGWKIVEEYLKQQLSTKYYKLMRVSPEKLKEAQSEINNLIELIESIYRLAACDWYWEGYKEIKELIQEEPSDERKLWNKYLEERRK